jgi:hypothetical protein
MLVPASLSMCDVTSWVDNCAIAGLMCVAYVVIGLSGRLCCCQLTWAAMLILVLVGLGTLCLAYLVWYAPNWYQPPGMSLCYSILLAG